MTKIRRKIKNIKENSFKELNKIIAPWFNPDRMQSKYNSIKDHSYHGSRILKLIFHFSSHPKQNFMLRNHFREDYGLEDLTIHGFFYKSASHLAVDYQRTYKESVSRSQCQRVLDVLVTQGILRRRKIGSNNKGIHHSTYMYRLHWKRYQEALGIPLIPYEDLKKSKPSSSANSVTPRYKTIEKLNTSYLEKRKKKGHSKEEPSTIKHYLTVRGPKQRRWNLKVLDFSSLVSDWRERAMAIGVKDLNLFGCKLAFEGHWSMRKWWRIRSAGWKRLWDGWCANWVQNWQEQFGRKRRSFEEPPEYFRELNDQMVTNRDLLNKRAVSFNEQPNFFSLGSWGDSAVRNFRTTEEAISILETARGDKESDKICPLDLLAQFALQAHNENKLISIEAWKEIKKRYE